MLIIGHLWSQDQHCGASRLLVGTGGAGKHLSHLRQMFPAEVSSFGSPTEENCSFLSLFSAIFPVSIFLVADIMSKIGPNSGLKCLLPFYVQGLDRPREKAPLLDISARAASRTVGFEFSVSKSAVFDEFFKQKQAWNIINILIIAWTRGLQEQTPVMSQGARTPYLLIQVLK